MRYTIDPTRGRLPYMSVEVLGMIHRACVESDEPLANSVQDTVSREIGIRNAPTLPVCVACGWSADLHEEEMGWCPDADSLATCATCARPGHEHDPVDMACPQD